MAIVGFNFKKIQAEKDANVSGKVSINNNIAITDVKEIEVNLGPQGSKGLLLDFDYSCVYEPKVGKIILKGDVINVEPEAVVKKCIESWKKSKTIDKEIMQRVMTYVLNKSTIQSIVISKDIGLPAPVPLPKINNDQATAPAAKVKK